MAGKPPPLQYGCYYHIFNRGNNRENIFSEERNYEYFLNLFWKYTVPIIDTYAYCLLRNHFHCLIRVKSIEEMSLKVSSLTIGRTKDPSQQIGNMLNAYAKAINKSYNRTGSLFQHRFGRIPVKTDAYFTRLIAYIHQNPQKHGFVDDFRDWPYSSYQPLISVQATRLRRDEVLEWFGGLEHFLEFHQSLIDESKIGVLLQRRIE